MFGQVINREGKMILQFLVINRASVLRSRQHTPANFSGSIPPPEGRGSGTGFLIGLFFSY